MKTKIGYLIPEFPGQTHIFFWRERQALLELGVECDLISTRKPVKGIISHIWADEAQKDTTYLIPFTSGDIIKITSIFLSTFPFIWIKCLTIVAKATDLSFFQRIRLLAMILVSTKLAWLAKNRGWTHIHVHSCADAANIALFASLIANIPYSMTLHGPTLDVYGGNQKQKWQYASFALIISDKLLEVVKHRLVGFLPSKLLVAPMGVNVDVIKRYNLYIPWQETEPCRIFSCGRLNRVKGHKYLIETVELLRHRKLDVHLKIAGEDEQGGSGYHRELEKIIQDKKLSEYVELLGAVSEDKIRQELENCHIFALASLNEGVPVAVMEAMAMELPVVVNDVGGVAELVDNSVDGMLVQSEQPELMADVIEKLLHNPEIAITLSQKSRLKIIEKFSHKRSAKILADCLEKLEV